MLALLLMLRNDNVPRVSCMLTMLLHMTKVFHFLFEVGSIDIVSIVQTK